VGDDPVSEAERRLVTTVITASLVYQPETRCECCDQVTSATIGWDLHTVPAGTVVPRRAAAETPAGVEPSPVPDTPAMPPISVEHARWLRESLSQALGAAVTREPGQRRR
jgi:hypothetical protein